MLTNLNELINSTFLNIPVGMMLMVLFSLYALFFVYRVEPKKRGYTTGHYKYGESLMRGSIIFVIILLVIFIVCYGLDVRDVDGNRPIGHIILVSGIGYLCALLYLYYGYKRIYFNDKEIIVVTLLKKERTYYWNDIIRVVNRKNNMIIVYTNNGKFIFDSEFDNEKKFIKKLEEKNILIENI